MLEWKKKNCRLKFTNFRNTANLKKINTIKSTYRHISVKLQQTKYRETSESNLRKTMH